MKKGRHEKRASAVRIFAGHWKGKRLEVPPAARPTSARAREALFDVLQDRVRGARVLDLFAGSGAVGLEAVSRGAVRAVLVEQEAGALERNVQRLQAVAAVQVLRSDAPRALAHLELRGERFDLVFADPPYAAGPQPDILLGVGRLLAEKGIFVLQGDAREAPNPPPGMRLRERRAYGRNVLSFFERAANSGSDGPASARSVF